MSCVHHHTSTYPLGIYLVPYLLVIEGQDSRVAKVRISVSVLYKNFIMLVENEDQYTFCFVGPGRLCLFVNRFSWSEIHTDGSHTV